MRGQATFQSLFPDQQPDLPKEPGKGRNPERDAKRNELLLARYYYYGTFTDNRYGWIIAKLADEFFLAERRIADIVAGNVDGLKALRQSPPTLKDLRRRWPHLHW